MKPWKLVLPALFFVWPALLKSQAPLNVATRVSNYVLRNNPFAYKVDVAKPSASLAELHCIDFEKNFFRQNNTCAAAYTELQSEADTTLQLELSYGGHLQVMLNGVWVYQSTRPGRFVYTTGERSVQLSTSIGIRLHKGINRLWFGAVAAGNAPWKLLLQANSNNVNIGLFSQTQLTGDAQQLSFYLVAGGFVQSNVQRAFQLLKQLDVPDDLTRVYKIGNYNVVWTLPRIELTAVNINPQPYWGTYYNYNYHAAGLAWAIGELGDLLKRDDYSQYLDRYCNFVLKERPFIAYQVKDLWQVNCTDHFMSPTPLLDFTSATAMPFIYRLSGHLPFAGQKAYQQFYEETKDYIFHHQQRLNGQQFTRTTPEPYTTWVDDMFMGLPFVVHSARIAPTKALQQRYYDDAAKQVMAFASILFDDKDALFHHASHSRRPGVKYPYWLRANGWGLWAITEVLTYLPSSHPLYADILQLYRRHTARLISLQDSSGMWHNIADHAETRLETSGTAIITLALARGVRMGWLPKEQYAAAALQAWKALEKRIDPAGEVTDIIVGSFTNTNIAYYEQQPLVKSDSHGVFCVVMCAMEVHKLMQVMQ
jgi:rhamnogalacturonyl hydrolase YesR